MSNYRGHVWGGVAAFALTFLAIASLRHTFFLKQSPACLPLLPAIFEGLVKAFIYYLPLGSFYISYGIMHCWPFLLNSIEWFIFSLAGAMFPDIDIKSKSQQWFYWAFLLAAIICIAQKKLELVACVSVAAIIPALATHRGLFHRLWFILLVAGSFFAAARYTAPSLQEALLYDTLFFIAGAVSHLWLDMGIRGMLRW